MDNAPRIDELFLDAAGNRVAPDQAVRLERHHFVNGVRQRVEWFDAIADDDPAELAKASGDWDESKVNRAKTTPESTPGSFAPLNVKAATRIDERRMAKVMPEVESISRAIPQNEYELLKDVSVLVGEPDLKHKQAMVPRYRIDKDRAIIIPMAAQIDSLPHELGHALYYALEGERAPFIKAVLAEGGPTRYVAEFVRRALRANAVYPLDQETAASEAFADLYRAWIKQARGIDVAGWQAIVDKHPRTVAEFYKLRGITP